MNSETRLKSYLATAAAAGAGVVASSASAAVVTSAQGDYTTWSQSLTGPGIASNNSWGNNALPGMAVITAIILSNPANGRIAGMTGGGGFGTARLSAGAVIGATMAANQWIGTVLAAGSNPPAGANPSFAPVPGYWLSPSGADTQTGYLAFRVDAGSSQYYYGYFEITVSRTGIDASSTLSMSVTGWAYENTAGQSITIGGAAAVPGGAGLAALAVGAAGLRGRRRVR